MSQIFLRIFNMSISASYLVLAVLVLRLLFKKAPKWIAVLLWGIVAVRLVCPFTVESVMSLIPSTETVSPDITTDRTPQINSGISFINNAINPIVEGSFAPEPLVSINPLQIWIPILSILWLTGIAVMLVYTLVSYLRVRRKVGTAVRLCENVYQSEHVVSPFVLGLIKPKIYLPFAIDARYREHVIAHERAHIRRRDHWWKPLGFLLLTVYWFNPLLWLGYVLLCRDIELACDEKVIKTLDHDARADYSQALLACSVNRRMIAACPLAFGEVGVKARIKSVLHYKKPAFWILLVAILACVALAVCFLTDPPADQPDAPAESKPPVLGETDPEKLNDAQKALQERVPEYFGLDTTNGLDVFVWQMAKGGSLMFGLRGYSEHAGAFVLYSSDPLWMKGTTCAEMRTILSTYDVDPAQVRIVFRQPLHSSYLPDWQITLQGENIHVKQAAYAEIVHNMLYPPCSVR